MTRLASLARCSRCKRAQDTIAILHTVMGTVAPQQSYGLCVDCFLYVQAVIESTGANTCMHPNCDATATGVVHVMCAAHGCRVCGAIASADYEPDNLCNPCGDLQRSQS